MDTSENTKTAKTRWYRSKSARLVERIMADIDAGEYEVGSWLPSESVLCGKYGAARLTIRRTVDRLAEQGLLERIQHRGVIVRAASPSQGTGLHPTVQAAARGAAIACILSASPDEGLVLIKEGVSDYAREAGLSLQVLAPADATTDPFDALGDPERLGVDGIIVLPYPGAERRELLEGLRKRCFPTVCVERRSNDVQLPSVEPDNAAGMYRAVNYLISRHRRPVYFLGMRCDHLTDAERYDGYIRAMTDAGFGDEVESHTFLHKLGSSDPGYWREERKWYHGFETARRLLKSVKTPLSVACVKDYTAWGLYRAAEERKLEIGTDIAVTGFDDLTIASMLVPPLTTVQQSMREKGYQAAKILHQRIEHPKAAVMNVRLPVRLVVRESV